MQRLEEASLWPDDDAHRTFIALQRARGEELRSSLLAAVVSTDDGRSLASEAVFGTANERFRERAPLVLAFGAALAETLCEASGAHDRTAELAELGALFNLGVSVFDLLVDELPALFAQFERAFSTAELRAYVNQRGSSNGHAPAAPEAVEIRLLLGVIDAFFKRARSLSKRELPALDSSVAELLLRAHEAEITAGSAGGVADADAARAKSTLPFHILGAVVDSCAEDGSRGRATSLAHELGVAFWLTDELVDCVDDFQKGQANALLIDASAWLTEPDDREILESLLDNDILEQAATQAVTAAVAASSGENAAFLSHYLRAWME